MKKYISALALSAVLFTACDSKLEITPYGDTTLSTVDELETLLNTRPLLVTSSGAEKFTELDLEILCNNCFRSWNPVNDYFVNNNSILYAIFAYDESIDRADLTATDSRYTTLYQKINYMNTVISKVPGASEGTIEKKERLVAEAKVLRAWYHFLLVGMYAQQYDEAKAEQLGGIPYVTIQT